MTHQAFHIKVNDVVAVEVVQPKGDLDSNHASPGTQHTKHRPVHQHRRNENGRDAKNCSQLQAIRSVMQNSLVVPGHLLAANCSPQGAAGAQLCHHSYFCKRHKRSKECNQVLRPACAREQSSTIPSRHISIGIPRTVRVSGLAASRYIF